MKGCLGAPVAKSIIKPLKGCLQVEPSHLSRLYKNLQSMLHRTVPGVEICFH